MLEAKGERQGEKDKGRGAGDKKRRFVLSDKGHASL